MKDDRTAGRREELLNSEVSPEAQQRVAEGHVLDVPLQLEVHPYSHLQGKELDHVGAGCSNECDHCTRGNDRFDLERLRIPGIDPDELITLIGELGARDVKRVVLSGNSTEPLLYPRIAEVMQAIKDSGMLLRLYSNFHFGEKIDRNTIQRLGNGDVIRVSLDAGSGEAYERSHHPRIQGAFEKIQANLEGLLAERKRLSGDQSTFEVHLTFLLTTANCNMRDIENLVTWANEHEVDAVRFNFPLLPKTGATGFARTSLLSPEDGRRAKALLERCTSENGRTKIIAAMEETFQPQKKLCRLPPLENDSGARSMRHVFPVHVSIARFAQG